MNTFDFGDRVRVKDTSPSSMKGRTGVVTRSYPGYDDDLCVHVTIEDRRHPLRDRRRAPHRRPLRFVTNEWVFRPEELERDNHARPVFVVAPYNYDVIPMCVTADFDVAWARFNTTPGMMLQAWENGECVRELSEYAIAQYEGGRQDYVQLRGGDQ